MPNLFCCWVLPTHFSDSIDPFAANADYFQAHRRRGHHADALLTDF
jgi:hypothetical protein